MESFLHISKWLSMAKENANPNAAIIVVGNKKDLKDERVVSFNEASKFCLENETMYLECSAFIGDGIEDIFKTASKNILTKVNDGKIKLDNGRKFPQTEGTITEITQKQPSKLNCSYC
jgi:Ras-related protein Rab-14